jgi:hypothetical protein
MQPGNVVNPQNSTPSIKQPDSSNGFMSYWRQHLIIVGLVSFFILGPIGLIIAIVFSLETVRNNKQTTNITSQPKSVPAQIFSIVAKVCIGSLIALGALFAFFFLLFGGLFVLSGGEGS